MGEDSPDTAPGAEQGGDQADPLDADRLAFEPPGPGTWHRVGHFPGPLTRYFQGIYPGTMQAAANRARADYGVLSRAGSELVDGYWYTADHPVVPDPPHAAARPESAADLEAEYHRRVDRMERTFETKRWRTHLDRWDEDLKPGHRDTLLALQDVDPASLADSELLDHVERCRDAALCGIELHVRMTVTAVLPVGDFLAHATEWTDRPADELLGLLDGASPESAGPVEELEAAAAAVGTDDDARRLLDSDVAPGEILDRLRDRSGAVGTAVERWLAVAGYRLATGYDLSANYALERPAVLVETLHTTVERGDSGASDHDNAAQLAAVRAAVPARHREDFEDLFAEARRVYRLKDEREIDLRSLGVLRRALLEVGRRLDDRGGLHAPEHVVDLSHDELLAAFPGGNGPGADAVADRVAYRESHDGDDAPDQLGPDPADPFEGVDLPEPAARARRAFDALGEATGDAHLPDVASGDDGVVLRGHGASPGTYEGPARVVAGPDDFEAIRTGDVLVGDVTTTAFNVVLPVVGAIVTDSGGMLSHPAVVAREFGIPAVVGCEVATDRIDDGDRIVVDCEDGTVRPVN